MLLLVWVEKYLFGLVQEYRDLAESGNLIASVLPEEQECRSARQPYWHCRLLDRGEEKEQPEMTAGPSGSSDSSALTA